MTPDQLKLIFDGSAILIMFVWGLVYKYAPPFAKLPNVLIPWINLLGYILAKLVVPDAHAGGFGSFWVGLGTVAGGFIQTIWARQLYEAFARGPLENWLGWKKAT